MMGWTEMVATWLDHRIRYLPVAVLNLIATCDSRCAVCDYWRNETGPRLGLDAVRRLLPQLRKLKTRYVLLSGGEPLLHPDLPRICRLLEAGGFSVLFHTNGLRLEERLEAIGPYVDQMFVSLDGASRETYRRLRGVDGFDTVLRSIRRARQQFPRIRIGSRTVLMKGNLDELDALVDLGLREGLRPLSFLGADIHSGAFGRKDGMQERLKVRLPSVEDLEQFGGSIDALSERGSAVEEVIEGGIESLRRILARYLALAQGELPESPPCNAAWYSAVIESDGAVRPCFFHPAYAQPNGGNLEDVLNGPEAVRFRKNLNVKTDPICRRCVCSKHFSARA